MFIYSLGKGSRLGILADSKYLQIAEEAFFALSERMVRKDEKGFCHLGCICKVAGLGGTPYRDGSFAYYIGEPVVDDDFKGVGPYLLAASELYKS